MSTQLESPSRLSEMIAERMEERNMGIKDLAEAADITYEHARRLVRGEGIPSRPVLKLVCQSLGLNFKDLEKLSVEASLRKKYGNIPMELAGKKPDLEPIERVWDNLSKQQKEDATAMIVGWAKGARARR